jgi:hypothetical protein
VAASGKALRRWSLPADPWSAPIVSGAAVAMCRLTTAPGPQRDPRHLRNSTPASLSASCYDTAISVKGSSRRAVHLSGSLEEHVRLQKVLGSAKNGRSTSAGRSSTIEDLHLSPESVCALN